MINIVCTPTSLQRVGLVQLNLPFSFEDVKTELENEIWIDPTSTNKLGTDLWDSQRYNCMRPKIKHRCLTELFNYFRSDELKTKFINFLYQVSPTLKTDWDWYPEDMFKGTSIHGHFVRDNPGFVNVLHTDYRRLVATGMIYWNQDDNEDVSTWFYSGIHRTDPLRAPTGFGKGWIHSNGNHTYHEGWNRTNKYRYSTLLGLTLDMGIQNTPTGGMLQDPKSSLIKE